VAVSFVLGAGDPAAEARELIDGQQQARGQREREQHCGYPVAEIAQQEPRQHACASTWQPTRHRFVHARVGQALDEHVREHTGRDVRIQLRKPAEHRERRVARQPACLMHALPRRLGAHERAGVQQDEGQPRQREDEVQLGDTPHDQRVQARAERSDQGGRDRQLMRAREPIGAEAQDAHVEQREQRETGHRADRRRAHVQERAQHIGRIQRPGLRVGGERRTAERQRVPLRVLARLHAAIEEVIPRPERAIHVVLAGGSGLEQQRPEDHRDHDRDARGSQQLLELRRHRGRLTRSSPTATGGVNAIPASSTSPIWIANVPSPSLSGGRMPSRSL
jgi:hypothetical protein